MERNETSTGYRLFLRRHLLGAPCPSALLIANAIDAQRHFLHQLALPVWNRDVRASFQQPSMIQDMQQCQQDQPFLWGSFPALELETGGI